MVMDRKKKYHHAYIVRDHVFRVPFNDIALLRSLVSLPLLA